MKRLVNIENPSIIITAPDELINEVGGNCYQIGGSQPLTYAKNLWRLEETNVLQGLDEAAVAYANSIAQDDLKKVYCMDDFKALNDLPRWKKLPNGIMKQVNLFGRAIIVNNHYILYSDLEKLPGFKED